MNEAVVVLVPVILALVVSLVVPNILLRSLNKQREIDKLEIRIDAERVRTEALAAAKKVERKADLVAKKLTDTTSTTNEKLDVIHTLVNSNLTKQMQATLTALQAQLVLLQEGRQSAARKRTIEALKLRIADLQKTLKQRQATDAAMKGTPKTVIKKPAKRRRKPRG